METVVETVVDVVDSAAEEENNLNFKPIHKKAAPLWSRFYLSSMITNKLIANIDYYLNSNGDMVFTRAFHLKRGYCCQSGCTHCPYRQQIDPNIPSELQSSWSEQEFIDDSEEE